MNLKYYNQMIEILLQKPGGMRLSSIVTNIYNMNAGLFSSPELYEEIYKQVSIYLYRESKKSKSPIVHIPGRWGYYGIRRGYVRQMRLKLQHWQSETSTLGSLVNQ